LGFSPVPIYHSAQFSHLAHSSPTLGLLLSELAEAWHPGNCLNRFFDQFVSMLIEIGIGSSGDHPHLDVTGLEAFRLHLPLHSFHSG
jgi:hypothetical protein